jgi:hypothetical protein
VFTWTNLLVVVAELDGGENEALDLVPLVTNAVLEVTTKTPEIFNVHGNLPSKETGHLWPYYIYMTVFIRNAANLAHILLKA